MLRTFGTDARCRNDEPPFPATRAHVYRPSAPPATAPATRTEFEALSPSTTNPRRISIRFAPLPETPRQRAYSTGRNVWLHPEADGEDIEGPPPDATDVSGAHRIVIDDVDANRLSRVTSADSTSSRGGKLSRKLLAPVKRMTSSGSANGDDPGWALAGAPLGRSVSADTGIALRQRPQFPNACASGS